MNKPTIFVVPYFEKPPFEELSVRDDKHDRLWKLSELPSRQVRCKVVGGDITFGTGRRAVLRPVPLLLGDLVWIQLVLHRQVQKRISLHQLSKPRISSKKMQ